MSQRGGGVVFDAFGDDVQSQAVTELSDRADHRFVRVGDGRTADEGPVDLQLVERQAASTLSDVYPVPKSSTETCTPSTPWAARNRGGNLGVDHDCGLGDLHGQTRRSQAARSELVVDPSEQLEVTDRAGRTG